MPYKDREEHLANQRNYDKNKRDKDKAKAYGKAWREANSDHAKQLTRDWMARQPQEYHILHRAKQRAKKVGVPFDIELTDVVIPEFCPYLEIPLFRGEVSHCDNSPSLDRVVPHLGYVKGNVQVISHKANVMKNSATLDELRTFCTNALRLH